MIAIPRIGSELISELEEEYVMEVRQSPSEEVPKLLVLLYTDANGHQFNVSIANITEPLLKAGLEEDDGTSVIQFETVLPTIIKESQEAESHALANALNQIIMTGAFAISPASRRVYLRHRHLLGETGLSPETAFGILAQFEHATRSFTNLFEEVNTGRSIATNFYQTFEEGGQKFPEPEHSKLD